MRRAGAAGLAGPGAVLAVASLGANVLAYVLVVALGRALTPVDFGAVAALLNLTVIGAVPGLALQLVAARAVATGAGRGQVRPVLRLALVTGLVLAGLVTVASPVLREVLHLGGVTAALAVGATLVPMTVTFAVQGLLQGEERFGRLSLVYLAVAVPRFAAGAGAAALGAGVDGVMTATLAASALSAVAALAVLHGAGLLARPVDAAALTPPSWRDVVRSGTATAGLLVLVHVDVLLARAVLPPVASGVYAAGAVFAKAAFWGPQFVSTLLYARMTVQASRRAVVAAAATVTALLGLGVVAVAALGGSWLVGLLLGERYAGLGRGAAVFAALGTALAVVQVLVYAAVAVGDRRLAAATWAGTGLVVAAVLVARPDEPLVVVGIVLAGVLAVVVAGLLLELRRPAAIPAPTPVPGTPRPPAVLPAPGVAPAPATRSTSA
jgi:O-antigen/teichoic acid export membrane protein